MKRINKKILPITLLVLLMVLALAPLMPLPASAEEDAEESEVETADVQAPVTIFMDAFEHASWSGWTRGDANPDSGLDYWDLSTYRRNSGLKSAYCAGYGSHSFHQYDNNMNAYMYKTVDLSGYSGVTLSFRLYIDSKIYEDWLYVRYRVGTTWDWRVRISGSTGVFKLYSYSIPDDANAVGFFFVSDGANVDEGAYIDDVELKGTPTKENTVLALGFTPNPVSPDATCTLSGTLKTTGGTPVSGRYVKVEYSTNGGVTWLTAWNSLGPTNGAGAFGVSFPAPGTPGDYLVRVSFAGDSTYGSSSRTETLKVTADVQPTVEIWTNKASYAKGEILTAYVQLFNTGAAVSAKVNVWFGLPGGGTYMYETYYLSLPAAYTSPVYTWKSLTIPYSAASGTYSVNAEIRNAATNALLDSDSYAFTIS